VIRSSIQQQQQLQLGSATNSRASDCRSLQQQQQQSGVLPEQRRQ
jgi:hypothetical protein